MTRKVEIQATIWPTIWLPDFQITPVFTRAAKAGSPRAGAGAGSAAPASGGESASICAAA